MHKDSIIGVDVIDYDFLGKKLYPPSKINITDAGKAVERFFRELDAFYYPSKKSVKNKEQHLRFVNPRKQPCTVKMYYTNDKAIHKSFLREYLTQLNKKNVADKPSLFNEEYDVVGEDDILAYEKEMGNIGFKFIISPESQNVPMKILAREFVKRLEKVTGHKFSWLAAVHTDTDHIHCHVLINSRDKKTKREFRFPSNVVKEVARELSIDICTELIGERSREMIELSKQRLPFQKRWTKIDEQIANYGGYYNFDNYKIIGNNEFEAEKVTSDDIEIQRLNTLVEMGLAISYERNQPRRYFLEKGWKDKLKAIGRYNTYLEARKELFYTPFYNLEVYTGEMGIISGIVSKIYNMDYEGIMNNAVVIENKKLNKAWYIPTRIKLNQNNVGKFITVRAEKNAQGKLRPLITIQSN